jgi:hypothetical protein
LRIIVGQNTNNAIDEARFAVYDGTNATPYTIPPPFSTGAIYGLSDGTDFPNGTASPYSAGVVGDVFNTQSFNGAAGVLGIGPNNTGGRWAGYFIGDVFATGAYFGSDAKLKRDIVAETTALKKLM